MIFFNAIIIILGKSGDYAWEEVGTVSVDLEKTDDDEALFATPLGRAQRVAMDDWANSTSFGMSTKASDGSNGGGGGEQGGDHSGFVARARKEWVLLRWDGSFNSSRCFHFEVNWLVCSGASVRTMCTAMQRQVRQLGLVLQQIPEYHRSGEYLPGLQRVDIHPFLGPVRLLLQRRTGACFILLFIIDRSLPLCSSFYFSCYHITEYFINLMIF